MRQYIPEYVLFLILVLVDLAFFFRVYKQFSSRGKKKFLKTILGIILMLSLFTIVYAGYIYYYFIPGTPDAGYFNTIFNMVGLLMLMYLPKVFFLLYDMIAWIGERLLSHKSHKKMTHHGGNDISRRKFVSNLGILAAGIPFASIIWGNKVSLMDFKIHRADVFLENLPNEFEDFTIVQISDLHLGSLYGKQNEVLKAIDIINELQPDILVFTGDLVNDLAIETNSWERILQKIKTRYGSFSILGNHDYGDYYSWNTPEEKKENFRSLLKKHREFGFHLLRNEHIRIKKDHAEIVLAGVENWGAPPFPQYGDLSKALEGTDRKDCVILLSHDPSHWEAEVKDKTGIGLCLSGHTHGFQFGIDIPGLQWSPVQYKYPRWAGLYEEGGQYLYVNRGFGYIGFPGRIGVRPEITYIRLKKSLNQS